MEALEPADFDKWASGHPTAVDVALRCGDSVSVALVDFVESRQIPTIGWWLRHGIKAAKDG